MNSNAVLLSPKRLGDGEANNVVLSSFCKGSAGCVHLCVGVWRLCRRMGWGVGGACTLPGHYIKLPLSARGLCTECQLPPHPPPLSVLPSPLLLAFQLLWLRLNSEIPPPVVLSLLPLWYQKHSAYCGSNKRLSLGQKYGSGHSSPKQDQLTQPSWTELWMISLLIISMLNAVPPHLRIQSSSPSLPQADSIFETRLFQGWMAQSCDNMGGFVIWCQSSAGTCCLQRPNNTVLPPHMRTKTVGRKTQTKKCDGNWAEAKHHLDCQKPHSCVEERKERKLKGWEGRH